MNIRSGFLLLALALSASAHAAPRDAVTFMGVLE